MSKKIFVLDDDENSCQLAEKVLVKQGYEVKTQTRTIGASNAIRDFKPDLLLLDVMMPALSGDNLVEILNKTLRQKPRIIFYSNKSADELRELAIKTGADGFVCKVEGPTALIKVVGQALG